MAPSIVSPLRSLAALRTLSHPNHAIYRIYPLSRTISHRSVRIPTRGRYHNNIPTRLSSDSCSTTDYSLGSSTDVINMSSSPLSSLPSNSPDTIRSPSPLDGPPTITPPRSSSPPKKRQKRTTTVKSAVIYPPRSPASRSNLLIGAHVSAAGGVDKACKNAAMIG